MIYQLFGLFGRYILRRRSPSNEWQLMSFRLREIWWFHVFETLILLAILLVVLR